MDGTYGRFGGKQWMAAALACVVLASCTRDSFSHYHEELRLHGQAAAKLPVQVRAGHWFLITVVQHGIDISLEVLDPAGTRLGEFESGTGRNGEERLALVSATSGSISIVVHSEENRDVAGSIDIAIQEVDRPLAADTAYTRGSDKAAKRSLNARALWMARAAAEYAREGWKHEAAMAWRAAARFAYLAHLAPEVRAAYAKNSVDILQRLNDSINAADAAQRYASTLMDFGDLGRERVDEIRRYLDLADERRLSGADPAGAGETALARGMLHWRQDESSEAQESWSRAQDICHAAKQRICEARALMNLAVANRLSGSPKDSVEMLEHARDLFDRADNERLYGDIEDNLAYTLLFRNRFDAALEAQARALSVYISKGDCSDVGRSFYYMGYALFGIGELEQAARFYDLTLHSGCRARAPEGVTLAPGYMSTEAVLEAIRSGELCDRVLGETGTDVGDRDNARWAATDLGTVAGLIGIPAGRQCHVAALRLASTSQDALGLRLFIAEDLLNASEWEHASAALHEIIEELDAAPATDRRKPWRHARALYLLGKAESALEMPDAALADLTKAANEFASIRHGAGEFLSVAALAEAQLSARRFDLAVASFTRAEALLNGFELSSAEPLYRASILAQGRGMYAHWMAALLQQAGTKEHAAIAESTLLLSERSRARALLDLNRSLRLGEVTASWTPNRTMSPGELIAAILTARESNDANGVTARVLGSLAGGLAAPDSNRSSPELDSNQDEKLRGSLRTFRRDMAADETLIEYFAAGEQTLAWVVSRDSIQLVPLGTTRALIDATTRASRTLDVSVDDGAQSTAALEELFDLALRPLMQYVRTGAVAIVADGALMRAPFAASRDRETGEYLIERHAVRILPSIHFAMSRSQRGHRPDALGLLAAGDPILDATQYRAVCESRRSGANSALPGAQIELASLKTLTSRTPEFRVEILQGCNATRERVLASNLRAYSYIHFATHSIVDEDNAARSGIVLTNDGGNRTLLSPWDLMRTGIDAKLVVLNGCVTAGGKHYDGEGPIGLTYGALVAGADQVLATLAPVADAAAARFVERFYRELLLNRLPPDRALQATQVAMLHDSEWSRPAYWASYVLSGEPLR